MDLFQLLSGLYSHLHQKFQVPKIEVLNLCKVYVTENSSSKRPYKVQETLHLRQLKYLVNRYMDSRCFLYNGMNDDELVGKYYIYIYGSLWD